MEDAIMDYRFNRTSEGFDNDVNTAVDNVQETVSRFVEFENRGKLMI